MVQYMLLLHNMFHPPLSKDLYISLFDLFSKIQIIDLLSIDEAIIKYQKNEIAYFVRFFSIYNSIGQNLKEVIVLGVFIGQLMVILPLITYLLRRKYQNTIVLRFLQYYMFLYCLFLYVPILSISFEFLTRKNCQTQLCRNDNSITLYCAAVINIIWGIIIQSLQVFFGRSDKIQDNNFYNQLQISLAQYYIIKVLQLSIIIIANLTQNSTLIFISVIAYITFCYINSFRSINMNHHYSTVQLIVFTTSFCYYLQIRMLYFLIIISISVSVQMQFHKFLICNILTQSQRDLNLVALSRQINHNPFHQYLLVNKNTQCTDINQLSQSLLKSLQKQNKQDIKVNLLYSNEIGEVKPLKALLNLLRNFDKCGYYYKIAYEFSINNLLSLIKKKQQQFEQQDTKSIDVNQVRMSCEFEEETLRQFCLIIEKQIKLWQGLMQGYQNYDKYILQIKSLSQKLLDIKAFIKCHTQFDNLNVIQLRVLQVYSSVIYLNPRLVFELEKDIEEKLRDDRFRMDQNINNHILNEGNFLILQTSLIQNVGQLIHFNKSQYRQYFKLKTDYPLDDIQYLDNFIPPFLRQIHPKLMNNYIRKGFSQYDKQGLNSYLLEPSGQIQNINIQINQNFSVIDDLIITTIISKNQLVNKIILISEVGQILGMDQQSYDLLKLQSKSSFPSIENYLSKGVWIQLFIKNISKYLSELTVQQKEQSYLKNFNNIVDNWIIPNNMSKNIKFYDSLASSSANSQKIEQYEERLSLLKSFDENNDQDAMFTCGQQVTYSIRQIQHKYKDGCYSYIQLNIIDEEPDQFTNQFRESSSDNLPKQTQLTQEIVDDVSSDQFKFQMIQQLPPQNCKFIQALSPNNINITQKLLDEANQETYEKLTVRIQYLASEQEKQLEVQPFQQKSVKQSNIVKQQKSKYIVKQQDNNSLNSSQSSYQKDHDLILNKIQDDKQIIKPLYKITILFIIVQILTIIIILTNVLQVQININGQFSQIELIKKPQDISYVITSLMTQYYFKLLNYQNIIKQSPFINYWNEVQLDYMNGQIYTIMQPQSLDASLLAQRFNIFNFTKREIKNNTLVLSQVPLSQIYQELIQYFLILYQEIRSNDYKMIYIRSGGVIRQNILRLTQLHSIFLEEIDIYITDQQLSVLTTYILFMIIQILIFSITFALQLYWWQEYDKLVIEFILILNRLSFQQAEDQVQKLQSALQLLEQQNKKKIQSSLQEIIFNSKFQQTQIKQLISLLPTDNYFTKWNLVIFLILIVVNILFNITGFFLYQSYNESFQPSLLSVVNYVQFLHDFDCSIMDGAFIKLDGMILDNNISNINQTNAILAFNQVQQRLLPQLNEFANFIYSSKLQENPQFSQLLYEDLCQLQTTWLIMCKVERINQTYWQKDQYSDLVGQGIVGYTGQLIKYIKQEFYYEFQNDRYDTNISRLNNTVNSKMFQNIFLQYFLDMQEILRYFLKVFLNQNSEKGLQIIQIINGYFIGYGTFHLLLMGFIYYRWVKYNQFQMILMRQVIGIMPAYQNTLPHYRAQIKKLYLRLY